mgnify:CR=1 FL=1
MSKLKENSRLIRVASTGGLTLVTAKKSDECNQAEVQGTGAEEMGGCGGGAAGAFDVLRPRRSARLGGLGMVSAIYPANAVALMQACALHLRDRSPKGWSTA